jgi:tRNA(His) 5'-end guanylyltransferase
MNSNNMEDMTLKDKCYFYQKRRNYSVDTDKYVIAHIDGRSFSKMIKNKFEKPFDEQFVYLMNETACYLASNVQGVQFAYVQSDEISLIIKKTEPDGDIFFGGRLCKMQSIIASLATAKFNQLMMVYNITKNNYFFSREDTADTLYDIVDVVDVITNSPLYQFDCKVWDVDNANDAMAWLLFRNIDCTRNSKQQTCQTYLSHKELMGKHTDEQVALLLEEKGINWFDLPDGQKYGRLIQKQMVTEERTFSTKDGIERTESCTRSKWQIIDGFDLTVSANRERITEMYPIFKDEGTI